MVIRKFLDQTNRSFYKSCESLTGAPAASMVLLTPSLAKETFTTLTKGRQLKEGAARAAIEMDRLSPDFETCKQPFIVDEFCVAQFFEEAVFRGKGCHQHAINLCCKPQYYCNQY